MSLISQGYRSRFASMYNHDEGIDAEHVAVTPSLLIYTLKFNDNPIRIPIRIDTLVNKSFSMLSSDARTFPSERSQLTLKAVNSLQIPGCLPLQGSITVW